MEKLVVVTFAGRKRYMEILFQYILKNKKFIDEYHIYLATINKDDIEYIENFQRENNDFVVIKRLENYDNFNKADVWNMSYHNCQDENTVYLKIDDDIVFLDENLFTKFIEFRKSSSAPLVFPHIINNIISTPMLEKNGKLALPPSFDKERMVINTWSQTIDRIKSKIMSMKGNFPKDFVVTNLLSENEILCPVAWGTVIYSMESHLAFLRSINRGEIKNLYTNNIVLQNYEPISIQCCSWIGKKMKEYISEFGNVGNEDEPWMSIYLPCWMSQPNIIYGNSVVSHFSSYNQESFLLNHNILSEYKKISKNNVQ